LPVNSRNVSIIIFRGERWYALLVAKDALYQTAES